jgi:dUTP pyrophosphatase
MFHMEVSIKRIDKELPLPRHETAGAVAFDLIVRETTTLEPDEIKAVPVNVIVATPPGYMFMIAARSSLARKKRLVLPNAVGIVDQDYCGEQDEVCVQLWNIGKTSSTVERGERIAQAMFVKIERAEWNEVEKMESISRGGFGSTGGYISQSKS